VDNVLNCDCGFVARAADEDGLVVEIQRHAWEAHGMELSQDEALLLVSRAGRQRTTRGATPRDRRGRPEREES
jgi:Protein of unknown function (DUF1059)